MNVALIISTMSYASPCPGYLPFVVFPVGFGYLAGALTAAGHHVIGVNPNNDFSFPSAHEMLHSKLQKAFSERKPELIGIGGLCIDYRFLKDAIPIIRTLVPDVPIVCGGGIITHDTQFIFEHLKPDFCICGEGEDALLQLVQHLDRGASTFDDIPNLGYWRNGAAFFTKRAQVLADVDSLSFPFYEPFDADRMFDPKLLDGTLAVFRYTRIQPRVMPIVTARGCPFRCTFCIHQHNTKYRARSVANIVKEIGDLYSKYEFNILHIMDELFAVDRKRLRDFCGMLMENRKQNGWDFDWMFQTHANADLGEEELRIAKEAGCYYFSYGMESASPRVLASMNKKSKPSQIAKAIQHAADLEIGFGGNYLFGDIAEDAETIAETMDYFAEHCMDHYVALTNVRPYPGSKLHEYCLEHGIIKNKQQYYETIDGTTINMTSFPDENWRHWIEDFINPLNADTPFALTVKAGSVGPGPDLIHSATPVAAPVWLVSLICPHCKRKTELRQQMPMESVVSGAAAFTSLCPACNRRVRIEMPHGVGPDKPWRYIEADEFFQIVRLSLRLLAQPNPDASNLMGIQDLYRIASTRWFAVRQRAARVDMSRYLQSIQGPSEVAAWSWVNTPDDLLYLYRSLSATAKAWAHPIPHAVLATTITHLMMDLIADFDHARIYEAGSDEAAEWVEERRQCDQAITFLDIRDWIAPDLGHHRGIRPAVGEGVELPRWAVNSTATAPDNGAITLNPAFVALHRPWTYRSLADWTRDISISCSLRSDMRPSRPFVYADSRGQNAQQDTTWDRQMLRAHILAHLSKHPAHKIVCYGGGNDFVELLMDGVFDGHTVVAVVDNYRRSGELVGGVPVIREADLDHTAHDLIVITAARWSSALRAAAVRRTLSHATNVPVI